MKIPFAVAPTDTETVYPTAPVTRARAVGVDGNQITVRGVRAIGVAVDDHTAEDVAANKSLDVNTEGRVALTVSEIVVPGNRLTVDAAGKGAIAAGAEFVSFVVRIGAAANAVALVKIIHS